MKFEHPVQHQDRQELLGGLVQHRQVLGAHVLGAAQPVLRLRATGLHVLLADLDGLAAHVQQERHPGFGQASPDRVEVVVSR